MPKTEFPEVLDSSIIASFRSCPQKANWEYFDHYKPLTVNIHLHAGACFARGLEVVRRAYFEQGMSEDTAIGEGLKALLEAWGDYPETGDTAKSLDRMLGALEYYFSDEAYPLHREPFAPIMLPSGSRAIEFSFAQPLPIPHPVTGNPLIYCGRFDQIVEGPGGCFGEDDKTTSRLGATWSRQWDNRSQFTAYTWGAGLAGRPISGFLVRGVSILKTKYETQQAITYRPQWMVDRWYEQLLWNIREMLVMWKSGVWRYDLDHACTEYSGCPFLQPCLSQDPEPYLISNYARRKWDPLKREEINLTAISDGDIDVQI